MVCKSHHIAESFVRFKGRDHKELLDRAAIPTFLVKNISQINFNHSPEGFWGFGVLGFWV